MSAVNTNQIIVSYRGIASALENVDLAGAIEAGTSHRNEAGEDTVVGRSPDDPLAGSPPPPTLPPPPTDELPQLDDLQRVAMIRQLERAVAEIAVADKTPGVFFVPDSQAASLLLAYMARAGLERGKLEEVKDGRYEVKFDDQDIKGWVGSFFQDWIGRVLHKHPFIGAAPIAEKLGNTARVALLGDWGTGLYGAPVCARAIALRKPAFDTVIHLGDIYYAGNEDEVKARFLDHWPMIPGARNRAVNANHEMYSGGQGYFKKVLPAFQQASSIFALQNDHYLLVGLDTGYDEHDLAGNQAGWLQALADQAGDRRIVLMSHHQPFSVFEDQGTKLVKKLRSLLAGRRIFAWYWGHEHRCMIYEKHQEWQMYGRLVGHSGYPYFRKDFSAYPIRQVNRDKTTWRALKETDVAPASAILEGPNPYVTDAPQKYGPQGWASLELDGPRLLERIHAADGTVLHEKELT